MPLAGLALASVAALHQLCSSSIFHSLVETRAGVLGNTGAFPEQAVSWAVATLHAKPLLPLVGDSFHLLRLRSILAIGNEPPPPPLT